MPLPPEMRRSSDHIRDSLFSGDYPEGDFYRLLYEDATEVAGLLPRANRCLNASR